MQVFGFPGAFASAAKIASRCRIKAVARHRYRSEAVAACIRTYEANADRIQYDLYRTRRLSVGSGVVESLSPRSRIAKKWDAPHGTI